MLASEARKLAGDKYVQELKSIQELIYDRAYRGFFSLVVKETISDYVRTRLQDDGYALTKTHGWEDRISW